MVALLLPKLVFILGITNLISLVLVSLSCRCMLNHHFSKKLWASPFYQKFYSYHCWYWKIFFASVLLHAALALYTYGIPF
ncbi:hypothetical protein J4417_02355 [Candidatus Woesearchaeota archaeon]|nr:hypothetical protein [Candidatus Woesearchaeota archaeon]